MKSYIVTENGDAVGAGFDEREDAIEALEQFVAACPDALEQVAVITLDSGKRVGDPVFPRNLPEKLW